FIDIVEHRYGHALAALVERAKIALTEQPSAKVMVALTGAKFATEITRAGLEATIARDIERVAATVGETIRDAQVKPSAITAVFLTGGSTAIPLAREQILALVPQASVIEGDMFGSVGLGLALDAQRKFA
ncbi:MAG: Hsp70 family protein, partial [Mesorhizobium sp.]